MITNMIKAKARICRDRSEFLRNQTVFLRDMNMQKVHVTFDEEDGFVHCPQTGHCWKIMADQKRPADRFLKV